MSEVRPGYFLKIVFAVLGVLLVVNAVGVHMMASDMKRQTSVANDDLRLREDLTYDALAALNKRKIVFLGNSVVYSRGFEPFAARIERDLGSRWKTINSGLDEFEIWRLFPFYRKNLAKIRPEFVYWFPSRNDFFDPKAEDNVTSGIDLKEFFRPVFFDVLSQIVFHERELLTEQFITGVDNKYYTEGLIKPLAPVLLGQLEKEIVRFNEDLQRDGTQLVVVFLPSRIFSTKSGWSGAVAFRQFEDILKKSKIEYVQLLDLFHSRDNYDNFYDAMHLNERGQNLVKSALVKDILVRADRNRLSTSN